MAYEGSIELISGIKPKNNGSFPLVDAKDVRVDDNTRLDVALQTISGGGTILAVDDTLSVAGQAADAKAAGDRLTELEGRVSAGDLIAAVNVYWGAGTEAAINGSGSTPV